MTNDVDPDLLHLGAVWPRGYKKNFMLNSAEHETFLLINVKMPTTAFYAHLSLNKCQIP